MPKLYTVGWEYLDPSVAVAVAVLGQTPPVAHKVQTHQLPLAKWWHSDMDIRLLNWLKEIGINPNGAVRTWMEVK